MAHEREREREREREMTTNVFERQKISLVIDICIHFYVPYLLEITQLRKIIEL
jgi:hypothetical protein